MGAADKTIALLDRSVACFRDGRSPELIEHSIDNWSASGCGSGTATNPAGLLEHPLEASIRRDRGNVGPHKTATGLSAPDFRGRYDMHSDQHATDVRDSEFLLARS
jgi:hypothetical protein